MNLYKICAPGQPAKLFQPENNKIILGANTRGDGKVTIPVIGDDGDNYRPKQVNNRIVVCRDQQPTEANDRCLLICNAVEQYDRYREYSIFGAKNVTTLAVCTITFGAAGKTNAGPEKLLLCDKNTHFAINSKYATHHYTYIGGEWLCVTL